MPAYARKEIVEEDRVGVYHCVARCVRRAFLCGQDPVSGRSFEHRKEWVRKKLEQLAAIFAIDIGGYAAMSNHLHVVLRLRPDVLLGWSDEEIARRWWRLFPWRRDKDGRPAEPEEHELAMLVADPKVAAERRRRLGSLSWLMRCLCEPIARRANREDQCTGRFWEGRFKCQALLDDAAVLACSVYVDLNPIRAAVVQTPEESQYTSAFDRIQSRQAEEQLARTPKGGTRPGRRVARLASQAARAGWLSPIRAECAAVQASGKRSPRKPGFEKAERIRRASSESFLPISLEQYLSILDWTGRQLRRLKRGAIPGHLASILDRLGIASEQWVESVTHFGRLFHRAAGRAEHLLERASAAGRRWFQGLAPARLAFQ